MTISQFAHRWLERQGMIKSDSACDVEIGQAVLRLVQHVEQEVHGYKDVLLLFAMVTEIWRGYDNQRSEIWQQYRDEQRRKAS